jgi:hypothetical protein
MLWENSVLFSNAARFARSVLTCDCILQMSDNWRRGVIKACLIGAASTATRGTSAAAATAAPMTMEQMFLMQTQAVQSIGQTLAAMQQVQQQQPPP